MCLLDVTEKNHSDYFVGSYMNAYFHLKKIHELMYLNQVL